MAFLYLADDPGCTVRELDVDRVAVYDRALVELISI